MQAHLRCPAASTSGQQPCRHLQSGLRTAPHLRSSCSACQAGTQLVSRSSRRLLRHQRERLRPIAPSAVLSSITQEETETEISQLTKLKLITAIKTPYLENGKFDLEAYDRIVQLQIENGVEGLIVGGTTGEGQLMSWDEHIMLIAHTVNRFGNRVKVIGNTGSNSTGEALHATEQGFAVGMHASLQINPYYGKTSHAGLMEHFSRVLEEGPAIVYNVPGRTGQDIPDNIIERLSAHEHFLGIKECTGNPRISNYTKKGIRCWSGNDDEAHEARHGAGAAGVISVTSNLVPGTFASLMAKRNDAKAASLQELIAWLFSEPNPIPLNTALAMCGLCRPVFRLPYVPLDRAAREKGAALLRAVQDELPGVERVRVLEDTDFVLVGEY